MRSSIKNEKTDVSVNCKFVDYAQKLEKDNNNKKFKEILENHPEIYEVIKENDKLKKTNDDLLDENIEMGERFEALKDELTKVTYKLNETLRSNKSESQELQKLRNTLASFRQQAKEIVEENEELLQELDEAKEQIKELSNKKGMLERIKDKNKINQLQRKIDQLNSEMDTMGRPRLSNEKIQEVIETHVVKGVGINQTAKMTGVSSSSVSKYVQKYKKQKNKR